jgi:hypothetical protein
VPCEVLNAKNFKPVNDALIEVRDSTDPDIGQEEEQLTLDADVHYQLLRSEYSDEEGKFTFRHFTQNTYSFYAHKEGYFSDSADVLVAGRQTPLHPHFYLPPRGEDVFKGWVVMQYERP